MLFLIWSLALLVAVVLYCRNHYSRFSRHGVKNLPPVPLLGDMARMTFRMEHFSDNLERIYKSFPNEKFVGSFEYMRPVLYIRDIDLVKQITVKDFEHFLDHAVMADEHVDPLFGRNLFALKGQKWKDMRSTLSPAFTSSKMRLMVPFMIEAGDNMITRIRKTIEKSGTNYFDVDFKDISNRYANDVIASCAFGLKMDSQNQTDTKFYEMSKEASQSSFLQIIKFFGYASFPKLLKALKVSLFSESTRKFFKELVLQTMEDREAKNIHRPDMIHLLMEAKKGKLIHEEEKESGRDAGLAAVKESSVGRKTVNRVWSDDDLIAQAVLFFIAGFESVAQAMTFLVHEMAFNPEVQEKLVQEIRESDRKNDGKFD